MLLRASAKPEDSMEGSPDHVGEEVAANDTDARDESAVAARTEKADVGKGVVPVGLHSSATVETRPAASVLDGDKAKPLNSEPQSPVPTSGTVVLDVEDAKTVPSFLGKPVRTVIEESEKAGLEVDIFGSGLARQQNPPPGSRLPSGGHVTVQFAR
jgi:hypothetical protein